MSDDNILEKLKALNIALPPVPMPMGNYIPFALAGNLLFLAGQGPKTADGAWLTGKVGADVTAEEAYDHSRLTGYRLLSVVRSALGSLDRVERVVKILGFVNSEPGFKDHAKVINGCSDLLVQVFGERGRHSRSAVGVSSLPEAITVEIEGVFEVRQN